MKGLKKLLLAESKRLEKIISVAQKRSKQIEQILRDYEDDEIEQIYKKEHIVRQGIEYKYECPIYLKGMGTIYPDFTFLSRKTEKEIYWEHCGMMDSPEYARNMVRKIDVYENKGIFSGERLILTYETEQSILSTEKIVQMVDKYLG